MDKSLEVQKAEAEKKARQYENRVKILLNKQRDAPPARFTEDVYYKG